MKMKLLLNRGMNPTRRRIMSYRLLNCVLLLLLVPIFGIITSTTGTVDSHSEKSTIIIVTGVKMDNLAFTAQVVQTHIDFNQKSVVKSTTEMERSLTLLQYRAVIIAYGTEDGIQLGKNILTWEKFGFMLETSPIFIPLFYTVFSILRDL